MFCNKNKWICVCVPYRAVSSCGDATDAEAVEGPGGQALTHALRRRAAVRNLPLVNWQANTQADT